MRVEHGNHMTGTARQTDAGQEQAGKHDRIAMWIMRLRTLADRCGALDRQDMAQLMLHAEAVILDCPPQVSRWCQPASLPSMRAQRLEAGAYVDFALALCSEPMTYMITRSCDGHALVTMALPPLGEERTCEAEDLPLAILEALARLLAQIAAGRARRRPAPAIGHRLH